MGCCFSSEISSDSTHTQDYLGDIEMTNQSEQNSPFRRWTTGAGAGSSYRHDHRSVYNKQLSESTTMAGSSKKEWCGGVARWSLGLEHLLSDPIGIAAFAHFLSKEFAGENIHFWYACETYLKSEDPETRKKLADDIWKRHLADGAPEPVNVDAAAKRATAIKMEQTPPPTDVFQQAQKQIFNVMKFDSYPRFLRSQIHADCARADLCGQAPPFLAKAMTDDTCPVPPAVLQRTVANETANNDSAPPKLKKSASNASERRRSGGGVSLMPWRRAGSRDRARDAPPNNLPNTRPEKHVADVVKATQAVPGGTTLCRVVLPDGATSVVEVDEATTVGKLVDRLLSRRNLLCNAYEVSLKEPQIGESRMIDSSSVSSNYAGREIVVDKRCLVRLEVGGRCVMVRCKPSRRLRHIVRPVIAKYLPNETIDKITVVKNGAVVDYETVMEELDGKKMSVVDSSSLTEMVRVSDLDTESLNDANLPLPQDGETERLHTISRSRGSESSSSVRSAAGPGGVTMVVPAVVNPTPPGMGSTSNAGTPPAGLANAATTASISICSATGSDASTPSNFGGRISPTAITSPKSSLASGMSTPSQSSNPSDRIFSPPSGFNTETSPVNSNMSMIPPPTVFASPAGPSMSVAVQTTSPTTVAVQTTMSPFRDAKPPISPIKEPKPSVSAVGHASARLQSAPGGIVRASLKQGPPLHQRSPTGVERYQTREAAEDHPPAAPKTAFLPRPPPPLPPKPSQRQPTLV